MKLRIWIPCILLLVILVVVFRNYFLEGRVEGFQAGGSAPGLGIEQTRLNFWSILSQDKAGLPITSGGSSGSGSSSGGPSLLARVMNPGPSDTFTMVYPKYISMYALAKYNYHPLAARTALINDYDTLQNELQVNVEREQATRGRFTQDPQQESCKQIDTMTMGFYGQLVNLYSKTQDLSGATGIIADLHKENMDLQTAATAACSNQGATPSEACITLATMDESIFPLLPQFDAMNEKLLSNGEDIQDIINTLVQAFMGMGCTRTATRSNTTDESVPSIETVFSSQYLDSLATVDTDTLSETLRELSPYYVSPNIVNYISGKLIGTTEFNSGLSNSIDYIKNMNKTTNSIVSLTSDSKNTGKYYNESTGGFTNCPPGYYCPPASSPVKCPVGFWCPGMNILGNPTDQPIPCDSSVPYSPVGASSDTQCSTSVPPGYYKDDETGELVLCPTGAYSINGTVITCPNGTFNFKRGMSAVSSCLSCPKGSYCKTTTSVTACDAGTYNELTGQSSASACIPCPAGTTCANKGTAAPTPCSPGTFSYVTGLSTKLCPPVQEGYYLPGSGNKNDITKIPCSAGYYCPGGTGNQIASPLGTYSDAPQLSQPKKCPGGTYGSTYGLTDPACSGPCDPGHICPEGSTVSIAIPCPEGTYCPRGSSVTTPCPAGYYCGYEVDAPTPCPSGTYNDSIGKATIADCSPCPPGFSCDEGTANPTPCAAGYYCTGGTGVNPCVAGAYCDERGLREPKLCPAGSYNPYPGGISILSCKPCTPGTWSNSLGEEGSCSQTCPQGSYCPSPNIISTYSIPSTALPAYGNPTSGTITMPLGSTEPTPCPVGTYCETSGLFAPTLCAIGTYSKLTGQSDPGVCKPCEPGTFCSGLAAGSATNCPPGTYCPISGGIDPNQCLVGEVCPVPGLTKGRPCPPGQLCDTMGEIVPRAPCPPGTYSTGGASTTCTPCQSGYYGNGADISSQCSSLCPAGYYCPPGSSFGAGSASGSSGSSTNAIPCPVGYYCPAGTGNTCRAGFFFSNGACTPCPAGEYLGPGGKCIKCAAGQSSISGSTSCTPCPAGTASISGGLCGVCPAGTYTAGNTCINCPAGQSSTEGGTCAACPAGQSAPSGGTCSPCTGPPGTYCPGGTAAPIPCAAPNGRYCIGGTNQFSVCPAGYVCPGGTAIPRLAACPFNYVDQDTQCYLPPGQYCATATEFVIGDKCFSVTGGSATVLIGTPAIKSTGSILSKMLY